MTDDKRNIQDTAYEWLWKQMYFYINPKKGKTIKRHQKMYLFICSILLGLK